MIIIVFIELPASTESVVLLEVFSWEPALWTLMSQGADAADDDDVKKSIAIFGNKQRLLSIDMKTKVVQHV